MHPRVKEIHARVNQKLHLGSRNLAPPTQEVRERIGLIKALAYSIFDREGKFKLLVPLLRGTSMRGNLSARQLELMRITFSGVLAESNGCGNCAEQASLSFLEFLKDPGFLRDGVNKSLEYFDLDCGRDGHQLLVLDRAASFSEEKPESWRNCQLFDTYNKASAREYKEQGPTRKDLYNNPKVDVEKAKIEVFLRLEKNLTAAEWRDLRLFLKNFKKVLTPAYLSTILTTARERTDVHAEYFKLEAECERIGRTLQENIDCFAKREKSAEFKTVNTEALVLATLQKQEAKAPAPVPAPQTPLQGAPAKASLLSQARLFFHNLRQKFKDPAKPGSAPVDKGPKP